MLLFWLRLSLRRAFQGAQHHLEKSQITRGRFGLLRTSRLPGFMAVNSLGHEASRKQRIMIPYILLDHSIFLIYSDDRDFFRVVF